MTLDSINYFEKPVLDKGGRCWTSKCRLAKVWESELKGAALPHFCTGIGGKRGHKVPLTSRQFVWTLNLTNLLEKPVLDKGGLCWSMKCWFGMGFGGPNDNRHIVNPFWLWVWRSSLENLYSIIFLHQIVYLAEDLRAWKGIGENLGVERTAPDGMVDIVQRKFLSPIVERENWVAVLI